MRGEWVLQRRMGESLVAFRSLDVSGGDCMREQSTSALKKTHACDWGQNQVEHAEGMRGVSPMEASAV